MFILMDSDPVIYGADIPVAVSESREALKRRAGQHRQNANLSWAPHPHIADMESADYGDGYEMTIMEIEVCS